MAREAYRKNGSSVRRGIYVDSATTRPRNLAGDVQTRPDAPRSSLFLGFRQHSDQRLKNGCGKTPFARFDLFELRPERRNSRRINAQALQLFG
jgi:hypothetical protein